MKLTSMMLLLLLFATWIILSGFFTPIFLSLGFFVSTIIVFLCIRKFNIKLNAKLFSFDFFYYFLWLIFEIVKSSLIVTRLIWFGKSRVRTSYIKINIDANNISQFIYANSITLTPGTVTVLVKKDYFLVNCLNTEDMENDIMLSKIKNIGL